MKDSEAPQHNGRDESGRRMEDPQRTPLGYAGTTGRKELLELKIILAQFPSLQHLLTLDRVVFFR